MANKTVWVTGASGGLGQAIVKSCLERGWNVAAMGRGENPFTSNDTLSWHTADLKDLVSISETYEEITNRWSAVDGLVMNAMTRPDRQLLSKSKQENWAQHFKVGVQGHLACYQALHASFKKTGGAVVTVSSSVAESVTSRFAAYAAAKAALESLTQSIAREGSAYKIRANTVRPGLMATQMNDDLPETYLEKVKESDPFKRLLTVEEVAETVCFLLSDKAAYITGQSLSFSH